MKKDIFSSFLINILGLFSLFAVDVLVSRTGDSIIVSSWATMKSILFIGVLFTLLGFDQAIVRKKLKIEEIFLPVLIQFLVLSSLITLIVYFLQYNVDSLTLFITLLLLSIVYILYASYRLNMHYTQAQFLLQGWKVIFLCFIFLFGIAKYSILLQLSITVLLCIVLLKNLSNVFKIKLYKYSSYVENFSTGIHYFFSLFSLTLSLYLDQLILNFDKRVEESTILFSHITFFVSPAVIFLGFAGFVLGPYLRNNSDKKYKFFKNFFLIYVIFGIFMVFLAFEMGRFLIEHFNSSQKEITPLAIALSSVVFLRYLYIMPSAYIGSFASNKLIRQTIYINFIGIIFYLLLYFGISRYSNNYLLAIVVSILIVWLIRILNGYYAIYIILKGRDNE